MTVGGVSVPAWPWAWVVLFLALYGLFDLCHWAAGRLVRIRGWWRDRRERRGIDPPWWWKPWLYLREPQVWWLRRRIEREASHV